MVFYLVITENCNLSCPHCIRGKSCNSQGVSFKNFKFIVNSVTNFSQNAVFVLTGGEPSVHPEFDKLLYWILEHTDKVVNITSNGATSFFAKIIDHFAFYFQRIAIQISLDGTMQVHDSIRGEGIFSLAINNIEPLINLGIPVSISTVVSPNNYNDIPKLRDYLSKFRIKHWKVSPVLPFGCADFNDTISRVDWNRLVDFLIDTTPYRLIIKKLYSFDYLSQLSDLELAKLARKVTTQHLCNCGAGYNKFYIYPDLSLYPCTCMKELCFGNLKNGPISDLLASSNALIVRNYQLNDSSPCAKCKYRIICNGGCMGMSLHKFGQLGWGDCRCPIWESNIQ